ncbi:MAG: hypothetical protein LUO79_00880 [Methanomassiliicoccales archaeon]|nr:hypothetical protein [Methanomassiliicoccales archaeon]
MGRPRSCRPLSIERQSAISAPELFFRSIHINESITFQLVTFPEITATMEADCTNEEVFAEENVKP